MFPTDKFKDIPTPFYFYDLKILGDTLASVKEASDFPGFKVHFAVKANDNADILKYIANAGLGADTVSIGEIGMALSAGYPASDIFFAGIGKRDDEICEALLLGIGCLNVESYEELCVIDTISKEMGMAAPVALRINPDIDAHTHHYITTGVAENKFGIDLSMMERPLQKCISSEWLNFRGFHFHIGSQITDFTPFKILCERINALQDKFSEINIPLINVGGGLGIDYENPDANPIPRFKEYFNVFKDNLHLRDGQEVHFELGRAIVGQCGSLISRALYVKHGIGKKFVILDAGMTDLIRPALYGAHHRIENLSSSSDKYEVYDIVGPVCESSDTFATERLLPETQRGDLIAIRSAGAYGESMSSTYNGRRRPGAIMLD